ncbi:MAG: ROK family protein [Christensenellales bacterium]|jgi:glucokinase
MRAGIDLGGTKVAVGLVEEDGRIVARDVLPTRVADGADAILQDAAQLVRRLCEQAELSVQELGGVGIGVPGPVKDGVAISCPNLLWKRVAVGDKLEQLLGRSVQVGNDADCAAIAEWMFGALRGVCEGIMITLGTGLGGSFLIKGRLLKGAHGCSGEVGHMVLQYGGDLCNCGRRGCFERYCAAGGLMRMGISWGRRFPDSLLHRVEPSAKAVSDCYEQGDYAATMAMGEYVEYLAAGIANLLSLFDPERIVIGGGVSQAARLFENLDEAIDRTYQMPAPRAKIMPAVFGPEAGMIGAAMLGPSGII